MRGWVSVVLVASLFAVVPLGPVQGEGGAETAASGATIGISNFKFTPKDVEIEAGETVTWQWNQGTHSVRSGDDDSTWCSTRSSGSCAKTFSQPGTFTFYCGVHPSMTGSITVPGVAPVLAIDSHVDGETVSDVITISGSASSSVGLAKVEWRFDGGSWLTALGTTSWSFQFDTVPMTNGAHTFEVRAVGSDSGMTTKTLGLIFANDPPTITIAAPTAGEEVFGQVSISGSATGPQGVTKVEVRIDDGPYALAQGTSTWSYSWDTFGTANGAHTITVRATGEDARQGTTTVDVDLENTPYHDVGVAEVATRTLATGSVRIDVDLVNEGNVATTFQGRMDYLYKGIWRPFHAFTFDLTAFNEGTYTTTWSDVFLVGGFDIRVIVDPDDVLIEVDEGDNVGYGRAAHLVGTPGFDPRDP